MGPITSQKNLATLNGSGCGQPAQPHDQSNLFIWVIHLHISTHLIIWSEAAKLVLGFFGLQLNSNIALKLRWTGFRPKSPQTGPG